MHIRNFNNENVGHLHFPVQGFGDDFQCIERGAVFERCRPWSEFDVSCKPSTFISIELNAQ